MIYRKNSYYDFIWMLCFIDFWVKNYFEIKLIYIFKNFFCCIVFVLEKLKFKKIRDLFDVIDIYFVYKYVCL